jgi:hypothetical protein
MRVYCLVHGSHKAIKNRGALQPPGFLIHCLRKDAWGSVLTGYLIFKLFNYKGAEGPAATAFRAWRHLLDLYPLEGDNHWVAATALPFNAIFGNTIQFIVAKQFDRHFEVSFKVICPSMISTAWAVLCNQNESVSNHRGFSMEPDS